MTCIAWDGKTVAADSLKCFGSSKDQSPVEKIIEREGFVFAMTGCGALFEPMIAWFLAGKDPNHVPPCGEDSRNSSLIVFDGKTACIYKPNMPYPDHCTAPDAWGAGADFAIGAMEAGASAARAVELAIKREAYCGGPVKVIDLTTLASSQSLAPCDHAWVGAIVNGNPATKVYCMNCGAEKAA